MHQAEVRAASNFSGMYLQLRKKIGQLASEHSQKRNALHTGKRDAKDLQKQAEREIRTVMLQRASAQRNWRKISSMREDQFVAPCLNREGQGAT
jgi:hypothetical protein